MSFTGTKRVVDLTSDCVETDTKRTKTETVKQEEVKQEDEYKQDDEEYEYKEDSETDTDTVSGLEPILFIVSFDGDLHRRCGDHTVLSGITGYQDENDMSFYTDEMHQDMVKSLSNVDSIGGGTDSTGPPFEKDDKLMTLYELCTDEAICGRSYRATVVFTYPL